MLEDSIANILNLLPEGVTLVAATKTQPVEVLKRARDAGLNVFGENRVQELLEKYPQVEGVRWHFIGHLQTNKVKYIVDKVDLIHSVDSVRLAEEISRQAQKAGKVQDILLEVNAAREESKSGFYPEQVETAFSQIRQLPSLAVKGLMGMVPKAENVENNVKYYLQLREMYDIIGVDNPDFSVLSMGMSEDYQVAVRCGANMVRIGSAIFGKRTYP